MIAGNRSRFAIEAEIKECIDSWVFGSIRFWIKGESVGNWDDVAALNACYNWLQEFSFGSENRTYEKLYELSPEEIYTQLMNHFRGTEVEPFTPIPVPNPARFDICHLGMSSFDGLDILLVKDESGNEKCIWKIGEGEIQSAELNKNEMENIATEFCQIFEKESPLLKNKKFRADES